jgi:hypothetical protein
MGRARLLTVMMLCCVHMAVRMRASQDRGTGPLFHATPLQVRQRQHP